mmetsp:Transcript_23945/g.40682  ORF Transcript_23945/g.40682 Transcript_23945/m.40682 type:complete len:234 (-) Transcript_23945:23-724(-)
MSPKIAVVLSGCGVYDGSEITEATAALIHLSRKGAEVKCFAPDKPQMHVVNHLTGEPAEGETRNVLQESARIARGSISPLKELDVNDFDAVVFPGGFGAAKNLCNLAVKGKDMEVDPEVDTVLKGFHDAKKVIGLSCIAPVLAAKSLPDGVKITMGLPPTEGEENEEFPHSWAVPAAEAMGAKHENSDKPCNDACIDKENKVVTCAAYMYSGKPHEIYDSLGAMVDGVYELLE